MFCCIWTGNLNSPRFTWCERCVHLYRSKTLAYTGSLVGPSINFDVPLFFYFFLFLVAVLATRGLPDNFEGSAVLYSQVQTASTILAIFIRR